MSLSTHVLDGVRGVPAFGVRIRWDRIVDGEWAPVAHGATGDDGRLGWPDRATEAGTHRLVFRTAEYFRGEGRETFYPEVVLMFEVVDPDEHHHVPLLLSPFAYSTYRGS
jgi:5-hydroxyisourate hydrolase